MERLLDELLFSAPEIEAREFVVDRMYVEERLAGIVKNADLSRYIL
jgi:ATP-dependent HslUV protease ATP-binding subunit HslU